MRVSVTRDVDASLAARTSFFRITAEESTRLAYDGKGNEYWGKDSLLLSFEDLKELKISVSDAIDGVVTASVINFENQTKS